MISLLKNKIRFLCIALLILLPAFGQFAVAAEETTDAQLTEFLDIVRKKVEGVTSFTCDFKQTRKLAMFAKPVNFSGRLMVAKPDKLRWEFLAPIPSALLFNGNNGLRCNDQAKPVKFDLQSDPVMHVVAEQIWLWLRSDYTRLDSQYKLSLLDSNTLLVEPVDDNISRYIGSVAIVFDLQTGHPQQVTITEPGGDLTEINFHSYTINPQIPQTLFAECDSDG